MQCPSCYNDSLVSTEEGKLVCDECGEEFAGYREEEMDVFLAGTAVSNRESQSSHARSIRERIAVKSAASTAFEPSPSTNTLLKDDTKLCEGAFILAKAIADKLIQLRFVHSRIKAPLFELLTHWAGRQHRGLAGIRFRYRFLFRPNHVLSLICLAALYVRSPMLPRDLCRLIATRQVPYINAWKLFPEHLRNCDRIREAFTPVVTPTVWQICEPANIFARDVSAWPPIRQFFKSNVSRRMFYVRRYSLYTAFPVGHLHITLLRLSRLLGLPDDFGARVLRFRELRMIAVKMARVLNRQKGGPWDKSRIDECDIDHIPMFDNPRKNFVTAASVALDMYGFPTDESVQVDFINTMRLCYGRNRRSEVSAGKTRLEQREKRLDREWNACVQAMERWLKIGNPEDIDTVMWSSMPPNVISTLAGEKLKSFCGLVDDILAGLGDEVPELWGRFTNAFKEIGASMPSAELGERKESSEAVQTCQYDFKRCQDHMLYKPLQGRNEIMEKRGNNPRSHIWGRRESLRTLKGINYRNHGGSKRTSNREANQIRGKRRKRDRVEVQDGKNKTKKRQRVLSGKKGQNRASRRGESRDSSEEDSEEDGDTDNSEDNIPWIRAAEIAAAKRSKKLDTSSKSSSYEGERSGAGSHHPGFFTQAEENVNANTDESSSNGEDEDGQALPLSFLKEPAGIGLAWTIIRCFFVGSDLVIAGLDQLDTVQYTRRRMVAQLNHAMRIVVLYVLGLEHSGKGKSNISNS